MVTATVPLTAGYRGAVSAAGVGQPARLGAAVLPLSQQSETAGLVCTLEEEEYPCPEGHQCGAGAALALIDADTLGLLFFSNYCGAQLVRLPARGLLLEDRAACVHSQRR